MAKIIYLTPARIEMLLFAVQRQARTLDSIRLPPPLSAEISMALNYCTVEGLLDREQVPPCLTPLGKAVVEHLCRALAVEESFTVRPAAIGQVAAADWSKGQASLGTEEPSRWHDRPADAASGDPRSEVERLRAENAALHARLDAYTKLDDV